MTNPSTSQPQAAQTAAARPGGPTAATAPQIPAAQILAADDLDRAVRLAVAALAAAPAAAWDDQAGTLEWDCWETVEHLADDLFAYAAQLGPATPPMDRKVPCVYTARRPGGPRNTIHADRTAGAGGLLQVLESCGALLSAMVRTKGPGVRAHHVFGASDPAGFAAMGVVETLVHTYDVTQGLGLPWSPPADICARVLTRLFPDAPADADPWPALLWSTGRTDLPDLPHPTPWRWHGEPRP